MITITFDIYSSINPLSAGVPLLKKYNLPGTLFITTAAMGEEGGPSWADINALARLGWEVGSRADTNEGITTFSDDGVVAALAMSGLLIAKNTGTYPVAFAPPFGKSDARVVAAARKLYDGNILTKDAGDNIPLAGFNRTTQIDHYQISRLMISRDTSVEQACDDISWAAKDKRWLILGFSQVVPEPAGTEEGWYQVSTDNLDSILGCVQLYVQGGLLKPVTIREGLDTIPEPPVAVSANEPK
jgi:peptidoglycan/xylan/chitin deacetylase (PgdA/CDA1 family)